MSPASVVPMEAVGTLRVSQQGFEPWTRGLRVLCSTAELLAHHSFYPRAWDPRPLFGSLISFSVSPTLSSSRSRRAS